MENIMSFFIVFMANVLNDILAVKFIHKVTKKKRWKAGIISALIVSLYGVTVIYIVAEPWHIVPTALGAFLGTVVTVKE